jgi:hypothetical protein
VGTFPSRGEALAGPIFHLHRPLQILRAHKNTSPHGSDVLPTGEEVTAEEQTHTHIYIYI